MHLRLSKHDENHKNKKSNNLLLSIQSKNKKLMKNLVLGNEAVAQGAIDAGISGVYAYPGTPSTEITEYIQKSKIAPSSSAS